VNKTDFLGTKPVPKLLFELVPPMMLVFLVQAMYNIVDSVFVAKYSDTGLAALSVIFPMQLLLLAFATGTGSGTNVMVSRFLGEKNKNEAERFAFHGIILGIISWIAVSGICLLALEWYLKLSADDAGIISDGMAYGVIMLVFSFGLFIESAATKILQAVGNMKIPMLALSAGAIFNVVFDYLLIFGKAGFPEMGIAGAAAATVAGQILAMIITLLGLWKSSSLSIHPSKLEMNVFIKIYRAAIPNIVMQSLYTVYIFGLNLILGAFSAAAVTVLGIYYKLQSFFFIPLMGMEQAILPVVSYNYGKRDKKRIFDTLKYSCIITGICMLIAALCFILMPETLIGIFSKDEEITAIGKIAFPIIGTSFIPATVTLLLPVYFQGIGKNVEGVFMSVMRQIVLFVPIAWALAFFGLGYVWLTFPITETVTLFSGVVVLLKNKRIFTD